MNNKYLSLGLLGAILILCLLRGCDKKKQQEIGNEQLGRNENTAIIINEDTGQITTINRQNSIGDRSGSSVLRGRDNEPSGDATKTVERTDGARDIRISIDPKGNVTYTYRKWGFQFSPEIGGYCSSSNAGIVVNDSFFFYRKHEVLVGLAFGLRESKEIRPYFGYAYRPQWKYLKNTAIVLGINSNKQFVLATSTQF